MKFNVLVVLVLSFPQAFATNKKNRTRNLAPAEECPKKKKAKKGEVPSHDILPVASDCTDIPVTSCLPLKTKAKYAKGRQSACFNTAANQSTSLSRKKFEVGGDSCLGSESCQSTAFDGGEAKIDSYSCRDDNACMGAGRGPEGKIDISEQSCLGFKSCGRAADDGEAVIGRNSCVGSYACFRAGSTLSDEAFDGYAFIDDNSCRGQATDDPFSSESYACYFMGYCGKAKVGKYSCNGSYSCSLGFSNFGNGIYVRDSPGVEQTCINDDGYDYEITIGDTSCRGDLACQLTRTFDDDTDLNGWKIKIDDYACIGDCACGCDLVALYDSDQEKFKAAGLDVDKDKQTIKIKSGYEDPCDGTCV